MDAAQQFAGREDILWLPVTKSTTGHFAWFSTPRPERANALQRGGERNHRARRQRHADVSAHRRLVPDLEGSKERAATLAEQRCRRPFRWRLFHELIELDDLARSSNLQAVLRSLSEGHLSDSRSMSVWMSTCGSENSQVPPASHA